MKKLLFFAFISSLFAQVVAPTGSVTFSEGATTICTASLTGANATCSTSSLSVGTHLITAIYSGDSVYAGSTSAIFTQIVRAPLITTGSILTGSPNPAMVGQSITLTDTVTHQ